MRILFLRALVGFAAYDFFSLGRHFARLHRTVSRWPVSTNPQPGDVTSRVCDAVNSAAAWYPKQALCLQRSVVTTCLLRSLGVPAVMVLGAQKLPFKAHAWVEINGRAVNERINVQEVYGVWERC
jgi:hypothetical protein